MSAGPTTLVLDIDETLVRSWQDPSFVNKHNIYTQHFDKFYPLGSDPLCYSISSREEELEIWGLIRPNYRQFISFVTDYFDNIVVWSAGTDDYVRRVVKILFNASSVSRPPKIIYTRPDCAKNDSHYHKPLSVLPAQASELGLDITIDPKRTLIIDDKTFTFQNNPDYGVLIPPFLPGGRNKEPTLEQLLDRSDTALLDFIEWVQRVNLKSYSDFGSAIDKTRIFKRKR